MQGTIDVSENTATMEDQSALLYHKQLLRRPVIAWPTLALLLFTVCLFGVSCSAYVMGQIPVSVAIALNSLAAYLAFTVGHDAAHGAVSRHRWLNDGAGVLSTMLLSPIPFFYLFRYVHMQHHRYVNEPALDPDHYCGRGPKLLLPLRWLSLDLHYFYLYLRPSALKNRPIKDRIALGLAVGFAVLMVSVFIFSGAFVLYTVLFLVPTRIATFFLAFAFDFLPHYPHQIKASDQPYRATANRVGFEWLLSPLLTGQNYHLAHHLYPAAPFYRYRAAWQSRIAFHQQQQPAQQSAFGLYALDAAPRQQAA